MNPGMLKPPKKQYQSPQLRIYGDVATITQSSLQTGVQFDARTKAFNKTH